MYEYPHTHPGDRIIKMAATDLDVGPPLRYEIVSLGCSHMDSPVQVDQSRYITIDFDTGMIKVGENTVLNRDIVDRCDLRIRSYHVTDVGSEAFTNLTIDILDVNNHDPVLHVPTNIVMYEQLPAGTRITGENEISATDDDYGVNGWVTYSLGDGWPHNYFKIDPITGVIRVKNVFSFHKDTFLFNATIIATDHGVPQRTDTAMVYVKIDDVNDHAPQFNSTSYVIPTSISSESGTLLHTFSVRDNFDILENSAVYVRIPSYYDDANDMFDVSSVEDSDDFILTLGERPRSQGLQVRNYTFRLEAVTPAPCPDCPQFQQVSYADVTVVVHPANDHCPEFNQSVYSESIVEEVTLSQPIMRVSASDPEQNNIRYTIDYNSTNLSDRFSIDAKTGDIMLLTTLDREAMPVHEFTVLSSDDGFPSLTCTSTVRITVTDINDNVPTFELEHYPGYIKENAVASVTRVRADDPDLGQAGEVEYRLTLSGELPFRIDSSTGEIFTTEELDFETKHQYSFPVYASNPDSNMQASATVEVNVIDVNEFQPVFETKPAGPVFIEQGLSRGAIVAVVSATDRDGGREGVVTYSFGNEAPKDYFAINSTTGEITFKGVFEETSGNGNIVKRQAESIDDYFRVQAVIVAMDGSYVETTDIEFHVRNSYDPNLRPNPTSAAPRGLLIGVVAGVVAAVVVIFIVLCICAMFCRRRRHSKTGQIKDVNGPMNNGMEMGRFSSQHSSQHSGSSTRSSRYVLLMCTQCSYCS